MKTQKIISLAAGTFIGFSAFAIIMVSIMAFSDPQAVMDLVQVKLTNNDAYSSIRGVYGGVGLTIFFTFVYLGFRDQTKGLLFAAVLWGLYAVSTDRHYFPRRTTGRFWQSMVNNRKWFMYRGVGIAQF